MRLMLRIAVATALLIGLGAAPASAKSYSANRFDVFVRILADGSLEITETIAFRFESGTFDHVYRELPTRRTDGIEVVSARMDDRPFPFGAGLNQARVSTGGKVRVEWRFPVVSDSTHVFVLTYVARGVVEQRSEGDVVAWRALPTNHDYRIGAASVQFGLPEGVKAAPLQPPRLRSERISGAVTGALRPESTSGPDVVARADAEEIRSNGWLETRLVFPAGSLIEAPPAWQAREIQAAALAPRWWFAAGGVLVAGLLALLGIRQRYDAPVRDKTSPFASPVPPEQLAPALAGALVSNGQSSYPHVMATLLDLAQRGEIVIEEEPRGMLGRHNFAVRRKSRGERLAPHERVALDLAFGGQQDTDTLSLNKVRNGLMRRFRQFRNQVREELLAAGLLDTDRARIRSLYIKFGAVVLVLAGVSAIAGSTLVDTFGPWPLLISAALAIVGVIGLIAGSATTALSNEGLRRAARWRGYQGFLKDVAHERSLTPPNTQPILALAVALGLASQWAKYLKNHPAAMPAWFHALSSAHSDGAFAAFIATSSASPGGGGAAGAGAAGGGGSGAG